MTARAMSQENVEIVRQLTTACNRQDLEAIAALPEPGIEYVNSPTAIEPGIGIEVLHVLLRHRLLRLPRNGITASRADHLFLAQLELALAAAIAWPPHIPDERQQKARDSGNKEGVKVRDLRDHSLAFHRPTLMPI